MLERGVGNKTCDLQHIIQIVQFFLLQLMIIWDHKKSLFGEVYQTSLFIKREKQTYMLYVQGRAFTRAILSRSNTLSSWFSNPTFLCCMSKFYSKEISDKSYSNIEWKRCKFIKLCSLKARIKKYINMSQK